MHFGLTNSPAIFQAIINGILRDMLNRFVFFIFCRDAETQIQHMRLGLGRLLKNRLYVKPEKCDFFPFPLKFCGGKEITEGRSCQDPVPY